MVVSAYFVLVIEPLLNEMKCNVIQNIRLRRSSDRNAFLLLKSEILVKKKSLNCHIDSIQSEIMPLKHLQAL